MDVSDLDKKMARENKKRVRIYNPGIDDFTVNFGGKPLTIHAMEFAVFPKPKADHVRKHLANHLLNKRGIKTNAEDDLKKILKEIDVV